MTRIQRNDDAAIQLSQPPPVVVIQRVKIIVVGLVVVIYGIVGIDLVAVCVVRHGVCGGGVVRRDVIVIIVVLLIVGGPAIVRLGAGVVVATALVVVPAVAISLVIAAVNPLLAGGADVIVVVPCRVPSREGVRDLLGVAALTAVERRPEGYLR